MSDDPPIDAPAREEEATVEEATREETAGEATNREEGSSPFTGDAGEGEKSALSDIPPGDKEGIPAGDTLANADNASKGEDSKGEERSSSKGEERSSSKISISSVSNSKKLGRRMSSMRAWSKGSKTNKASLEEAQQGSSKTRAEGLSLLNNEGNNSNNSKIRTSSIIGGGDFLSENSTYDDGVGELKKRRRDENQLPLQVSSYERCDGFDFTNMKNINWVTNQELVYTNGTQVLFFDVLTGEQRTLHGKDTGGIGAVEISKCGTYLAVAETESDNNRKNNPSSTTNNPSITVDKDNPHVDIVTNEGGGGSSPGGPGGGSGGSSGSSGNNTIITTIGGGPRIFIYLFSTNKVYRILRKCSERGYVSVSFSPHNGNQLASLGAFPDYLLTVWNWKAETILLKCKAYGQDVFSLKWGQFPGQLITNGTGHIRFWKMATTFSGLKLQGALGKFGGTELTDIRGYIELPDGKIVSGSEYGKLLLWENVFIKCELVTAETGCTDVSKCSNAHIGQLNVVLWEDSISGKFVISGGEDGFIRWWPFEDIDIAEADYDSGSLNVAIPLIKELEIPKAPYRANIQHISVLNKESSGVLDREWIIQDSRNGVIWNYNCNNQEFRILIKSHSGPITSALTLPPYYGSMITGSTDGTIRVFNITEDQSTQNSMVFSNNEGNPYPDTGITEIILPPAQVDPSFRTLFVGYTNGIIRTWTLYNGTFVLRDAQKPFSNKPVIQMSFSPNTKIFACIGGDQCIFFFQVKTNWVSSNGTQMQNGIFTNNTPAENNNHTPAAPAPTSDNHNNTAIPTTEEIFVLPDPDTISGATLTGAILLPLAFQKIHASLIAMDWHPSSTKVLLTLKDGTICEIQVPNDTDNTETFEVQLKYRVAVPEIYKKKIIEEDDSTNKNMKKKIPIDDDDEAIKEEAKIEGVIYAPVPQTTCTVAEKSKYYQYQSPSYGKILFAASADFRNNLYEMDIENLEFATYPAKFMEDSEENKKWKPKTSPGISYPRTIMPGIPVTLLSRSRDYITIGFQDSRVWLLPIDTIVHDNSYIQIQYGSARAGAVRTINLMQEKGQEKFCIIGGDDGVVYTVSLAVDGLKSYQEAMGKAGILGTEVATQKFESQWAGFFNHLTFTEVKDWRLESLKFSPPAVEDIIKPETFSIQEDKLRSELENAKAAAEKKKNAVKEKISVLRRELEGLRDRNRTDAGGELIPNLVVDPSYIEIVKKEQEQRIQLVHTELSWEIEYHELSIRKLKQRFLEDLDHERIVVTAFMTPSKITTFRVPRLANGLKKKLAGLHSLIFGAGGELDDQSPQASEEGGGIIDDEGNSYNKGGNNSSPQKKTGATIATTGGEIENINIHHQSVGTTGVVTDNNKPLSSAEVRELRRKARLARKAEMQELEASKPKDDEDDVRDLDAIAHARATLGNYLLKTNPEYRVPESQRINAEKKRRQMFLLEESVHAIKLEFTHKILALREFKEEVKRSVKRDLIMLKQIGGKNVEHYRKTIESIKSANEYPERRFDFDDKDLEAFQKEKKLYASPPNNPMVEAAVEGGGDGDGEGEGRKDHHKEEYDIRSIRLRKMQRRQKHLVQQPNVEKHEINNACIEEYEARTLWNRLQLENQIKEKISGFDEAVGQLEKERGKLESDLKNADTKLLLLFEELITLNSLEARDSTLMAKSEKCRSDRSSIMNQIRECQEKLTEKKTEIESWRTEEANLQKEFTDLVGENSPFLPVLLKIYKKKVKRKKRKEAEEDDDDDDDDDEDEEDDDDEGSDLSDEEEDICPQGCDMSVYESVVELRDKRSIMEEALSEIQKTIDELRRMHAKFLSEEKKIEKDQIAADAEIQSFQSEKQRMLNKITVAVTLRLSQIQCLVNPQTGDSGPSVPQIDVDNRNDNDDVFSSSKIIVMPKFAVNLEEYVIFPNHRLVMLMLRITELHQEKQLVRIQYKELQKDYVARSKAKKIVQSEIEILNQKLKDIQMLKFGRVVDLDLIERNNNNTNNNHTSNNHTNNHTKNNNNTKNNNIEDMFLKIEEAELESLNILKSWNMKIKKLKLEYNKETEKNSILLEHLVTLGYSKIELDQLLNSRIENVTISDDVTLELKIKEEEKIQNLITAQATEIATLQAEIQLFRKKGGHIYTTITSNRN